jgi:hypothetical protein
MNAINKAQAICCSLITIPMGLYLFWFFNDIFAEKKPFLGANIVNLFGFIICATVIFVVTKINLFGNLLGTKIPAKTNVAPATKNLTVDLSLKKFVVQVAEKNTTSTQNIKPLQTKRPTEKTQVDQSKKSTSWNRQTEKPINISYCKSFQTLIEQSKSNQFPDNCLLCNKLLDCLTKTKSTANS